MKWWAVSDLNAGPSGCKPDALTAELTARPSILLPSEDYASIPVLSNSRKVFPPALPVVTVPRPQSLDIAFVIDFIKGRDKLLRQEAPRVEIGEKSSRHCGDLDWPQEDEPWNNIRRAIYSFPF